MSALTRATSRAVLGTTLLAALIITSLVIALSGCAGQVFYTHPVTGKHAACAYRPLGLDHVQLEQCKERFEHIGGMSETGLDN